MQTPTLTSIPLAHINDVHVARPLTVSIHVPQRVALGHGRTQWGTTTIPMSSIAEHLTADDLAVLVRLHDSHSALVCEGFEVDDVVAACRREAATQKARRDQMVADAVAAIRARKPLEQLPSLSPVVLREPEVVAALAARDDAALRLLDPAQIPQLADLVAALIYPQSAVVSSWVDAHRADMLTAVDEDIAYKITIGGYTRQHLESVASMASCRVGFISPGVVSIGSHNGISVDKLPKTRAALDAIREQVEARQAEVRRQRTAARRALVEGVMAPTDPTAIPRLEAGYLGEREVQDVLRRLLRDQVTEGLRAAGIETYDMVDGRVIRLSNVRPVRELSATLYEPHQRLQEYAAGVVAGGAFAGGAVTATVDMATVLNRYGSGHPDADEDGDVEMGDLLRLIVTVETAWGLISTAVPVMPLDRGPDAT